MEIKNNKFTAVEWSGDAIQSLGNITKAILNITELFKGCNVNVNGMLIINPTRIDDENVGKENNENKPEEEI